MMWVVVPLKDFMKAKQRLSGCLTPSERRGLFQAMVEDVLGVLSSHPAVENLVLLSDDPAAYLLAEHFAAQCWSEREFSEAGLNPLLSAAMLRIGALDPEAELMIVHGDLPLLSAAELDSLLHIHRSNKQQLTIANDRHGLGTNVLICRPSDGLPLAYGENSCSLHLQHAERLQLNAAATTLGGISIDVDCRDDLLLLLDYVATATVDKCIAENTLKFLNDSGIAQRIQRGDDSVANDQMTVTAQPYV
ncbi:MAG: 2-phospho-L-lactate guanylyltransferase [Spongiibacteraceae bacterium]